VPLLTGASVDELRLLACLRFRVAASQTSSLDFWPSVTADRSAAGLPPRPTVPSFLPPITFLSLLGLFLEELRSFVTSTRLAASSEG